jgi:mono/diheme cytochrome c family protein
MPNSIPRLKRGRACDVISMGMGLVTLMLLRPDALAADAAQGEKLARRWCAACHVVADDQTHGADNVPTFAAIGRIPGFDASKIAQFLRDPHPKMPDMQLSNPEAADLAAYIFSLSK